MANQTQVANLDPTIDTPQMLESYMDRAHYTNADKVRYLFGAGKPKISAVSLRTGTTDPIKILDMSYWQDDKLIDYDLLAKSVDGVILRGAYGIWKDTRFDIHYNNLISRGVPIGSYDYLIGNYTGVAQAGAFGDAIKGKDLKLGLWMDVEDRRITTRISKAVTLDFDRRLTYLTGIKGDVYTGSYAWDEIMGDATFADRKLWIANYYVNAPRLPQKGGWKTWALWQYTDRGYHPGYGSQLDTNYYNGTESQFNQWIGLVEDNTPAVEMTVWAKELDTWARSQGYAGSSPK